ncbi:MAG: hypothetical protein ACOYYS_13635 [Chloroflexota bacterium]
MTKADEYRRHLQTLPDWDAYLLQESGLPGPRGNLELAQAVADEGDLARFQRYLAYSADVAPTNSPYEFLAFCAAVGLGRLLAEGRLEFLPILRTCASDPRWRLREGVAMALQRLGDADMDALLAAMQAWSGGTCLEQRAAAAGLCEPRLLRRPHHAAAVLQILDRITAGIPAVTDRRSEEFQALRKGLGYCWSVAVAALPAEGKTLLEKWLHHPDKDIRWIVKENLKKNRLVRMDAGWVQRLRHEADT